MKNKIIVCAMLVCFAFIFVSCTTAPKKLISDSKAVSVQAENPPKDVLPTVVPTPEPTPDIYQKVYTTPPYLPQQSGIDIVGGESIEIDYSNSSQGYIMVLYKGSHQGKIKFRILGPDQRLYTYDLNGKTGYQVFPLTGGNGTYTVETFEQVSGQEYAIVDSSIFSAQLASDFIPYLYPNQFVDFSASSKLVPIVSELAKQNETVLQLVEKIYNYTMQNMTYDDVLAANVKTGYLPDLDFAIDNKTGICFDYASLMAAMLRCQGVPTKLVVGWSGDIYHAWINVYIEDKGWVNGIIQFNGNEWKLMDPTFADNGNQEDWIMQYIGSGANYQEKYIY